MSDSNVPDYKNAVLVSVEEGITVPDWIERVEPFVRRVLETMNIERWELSVMFCSDAFIKQLNEQYRSIDNPTDVLSFEQNSTYISDDGVEWFSAGDIVISIDTLFKNVEQFSVTPDEELKRLLIHGILHLAGHDHSDNSPEQEMLKLQESILSGFLNEKDIIIEK